MPPVSDAAEPEIKPLFPNPSFEEVKEQGGVLTADGWSCARWNNKEAITGVVEETPGATGKMALRVPACGPLAIGFSSSVQAIPEGLSSITLHLRIKKSVDFTATPWVFFAWVGNGSFLDKTVVKIAIKSGEWDVIDAEVPRNAIPAGADHFNLNLAVLGKEGATGNVWYDDAVVIVRNAAPAASVPLK